MCPARPATKKDENVLEDFLIKMSYIWIYTERSEPTANLGLLERSEGKPKSRRKYTGKDREKHRSRVRLG